jgi:hypothetical protein
VKDDAIADRGQGRRPWRQPITDRIKGRVEADTHVGRALQYRTRRPQRVPLTDQRLEMALWQA